MFDVASSTYIAIVPPFFGLYFMSLAEPGGVPAGAVWGATVALGLMASGVLAPIAGAVTDAIACRACTLRVASYICVAATVLIPVAADHGLLLAAVLFLVAQTGYTIAASLYDSYLVDIAPAAFRGRASGFGWALGMFGGIAVVGIALVMISSVPAATQTRHLGAIFLMSGVAFGVLAIPALSALHGISSSVQSARGRTEALIASLRQVRATLAGWRTHSNALRALWAFFLINDALVTLQFFIAIVLSVRFGLTVEGLLWLSLLFHVIAIPSTILMGTLADRWGRRRAIVAMSAALACAVLLLAFSAASWAPAAAIALLGLVFAALQSNFRAMFAALVPADQAAELFGFNAIAGRLSAALGPLIFGSVSALSGNTSALCLLLIPLAVGVALLLRVRLSSDGTKRGSESLATVVDRGSA
jgi:UMF1 family MFS transporter